MRIKILFSFASLVRYKKNEKNIIFSFLVVRICIRIESNY